MKAWPPNYGQQDAVDVTRRCEGSISRALRAVIRLWGTFALDAAERHLRNLDERTLKDLGFDLRDLPARDQLARRSCASSLMSNVGAAMDYWQ